MRNTNYEAFIICLSSFCYFLSFLGPNILLSILFSNILNLFFP